jgi:hypothetical protein
VCVCVLGGVCVCVCAHVCTCAVSVCRQAAGQQQPANSSTLNVRGVARGAAFTGALEATPGAPETLPQAHLRPLEASPMPLPTASGATLTALGRSPPPWANQPPQALLERLTGSAQAGNAVGPASQPAESRQQLMHDSRPGCSTQRRGPIHTQTHTESVRGVLWGRRPETGRGRGGRPLTQAGSGNPVRTV